MNPVSQKFILKLIVLFELLGLFVFGKIFHLHKKIAKRKGQLERTPETEKPGRIIGFLRLGSMSM
jgi:hypothetical protein